MPLPFREDDDLDVGIVAALVEDARELVELRAVARGIVLQDARRVADHAHHVEQDHQQVLLLRRERAALAMLATSSRHLLLDGRVFVAASPG